MIIIISIIISMVVFGCTLKIAIRDYEKNTEEGQADIRKGAHGIIYSFFMLIFMLMYMMVIIYLMYYKMIGAFFNSLILVLWIWISNLVASLILEVKHINTKTRKSIFYITIVEIGIMLILLGCIENIPLFFEWASMDFAIIVGFFVSLDWLLSAKSSKELKSEIKLIKEEWKLFWKDKSNIYYLICSLFAQSLIIFGAMFTTYFGGKVIILKIKIGMLIGLIIVAVILLYSIKKNQRIEL